MQWNSDERTSGGFMSSSMDQKSKPWLPTNKNFKDLNVEVLKLIIHVTKKKDRYYLYFSYRLN